MTNNIIIGEGPIGPMTPSHDWICAICRETEWNYTDNRVLTLYTTNPALCKHIFHLICATQRPQETTTCAMCRQPVREISLLCTPQQTQQKKLPTGILAAIAVVGAIAGAFFSMYKYYP